MSDKPKIVGGLIVFLVLATFPIWYTLGAGGDVSPPDLQPADESSPLVKEHGYHCVEDAQYMRANHMNLLDDWRNAVVRDGQQYYTSKAFGEHYEMSLTKTCMGCHTDRQAFCARCHDYSDVQVLQPLQASATTSPPGRAIRCWDCHVESKKG